ncbi:multiheme c-type cytochrome [Psychrobium sp. nBUS_13]|uniref:multiheme c-type cytochrome n=1 Tax=Psychrobium sp. nBUS_13 TaxID=3395319 RepID=UPI003EB783D2
MHQLCVLKLLLVLFIVAPFSIKAQSTNPSANYNNCIGCHKSEYHSWQQSDHAKAMALATSDSVKGDFDNKRVTHYGQQALFFVKNGQYRVTISYGERRDDYPIKYTFGHFPLQQYLVETQPGKLQVLPFAWDSRDKIDGGQRWYHNYSHEEIAPKDRLHWRQPLQNWNGMCADCHSDGLKRNYDSLKNTFNTTFDNINVGCQSCHGKMSKHGDSITENNVDTAVKTGSNAINKKGYWLREKDQKTASWRGKQRDNSFMDGCFACHSLRAPLTDGFKPRTPFLQQFMPQMPTAPSYHVDGQIKEEVYVYGSFLQSKMFAKGVNCLDCHDKHTMKVKAANNGLCLQCHSGEQYNVKSHHQHPASSAGAKCVNCHMPTTRYMGVDDRRDHSFKVPRPDLSIKYGTPNACINCHKDKNNQWASDTLTQWHGKPTPYRQSKQLLMALNSGQGITLDQHLSIVADNELDIISRASALQQLNMTTQTVASKALLPYLTHLEPLLRLSAANAAALLSPDLRVEHLSPLLTDNNKAVRVAAATSLATDKIATSFQRSFIAAFEELKNSNEINSWRGEGKANQGMLAMRQRSATDAEKAFLGAINVEPYYETGYINLADLYRSMQRHSDVKKVLDQGLKNLPKSGALSYAYGLHLVRMRQHQKALDYFQQATVLDPQSSQYLYAFILSLDGQGESSKALVELKNRITGYRDRQQLKELGRYLANKSQHRAMFEWFTALK